jgi:hypothetical protein
LLLRIILNKYLYIYVEIELIMGKAIVKLNIATYAGEEYVVEVSCNKDDVDEIIIARAWKKLKEDEGGSIPYGDRSAEIIKRSD